MKKILILYTSVGLGHKFIAQNIGWHLEQAGFEVKLADIGQVQKGSFQKNVVGIHQFINKHLSFIWDWLYDWGYYVVLPFRVSIAGFNSRSAKKLIEDLKPDLIITTQTTASAVVAYLKKRGYYKGLFAVAFSDYHLHDFWLYKEADFYLANIEEQKRAMIVKGVAKEKIFVCGITLKPKIVVDAGVIKSKFGVNNGQRIILIGTGSMGIGFDMEDLRGLSELDNVKIIFACGKNELLKRELQSLGYPNIVPLSFYQPMDELYAVADIFVGKPGGLSTAEALRWHLPLVVSFTLPGQEKKNVEYLKKNSLIITREGKLSEFVRGELDGGRFKSKLRENPFIAVLTDQSGILVSEVKKCLTES